MTISKEDALRYAEELDQNASAIFDDRVYIRRRLEALLGEKNSEKVFEFIKDRDDDLIQHLANIKGLAGYLKDKADSSKR